jgi:hypothetical protein
MRAGEASKVSSSPGPAPSTQGTTVARRASASAADRCRPSGRGFDEVARLGRVPNTLAMSHDSGALAWAQAQVAATRDDPAGRLALLARTYHRPTGRAPRRLPFRRAALSFMRWQAERGLLNPLDVSPPGRGWWRAVNERLLRDVQRYRRAPSGPDARLRGDRAAVTTPIRMVRRRARRATVARVRLRWQPNLRLASIGATCVEVSGHAAGRALSRTCH